MLRCRSRPADLDPAGPDILSDNIIGRGTIPLLLKDKIELTKRVDLLVQLVAAVREGTTLVVEVDVSPRPVVLVGMEARAAVELDFEHPHEVVYVLGGEVQQRLPLRRIALGRSTANPSSSGHPPTLAWPV